MNIVFENLITTVTEHGEEVAVVGLYIPLFVKFAADIGRKINTYEHSKKEVKYSSRLSPLSL